MDRVTVRDIAAMKKSGEKIPVLTAYSCPVARTLDRAGIPIVMVGDSVGMVEAGYETTLPVTVDEMTYHTRAVARGCRKALVVADLPFASYQVSVEDAKRNAARLVKEGGAQAVKLEGGRTWALTIRAIVDMGVPVMAHLGLTPQSVHAMGGYRVQGWDERAAEVLREDARAVEEAGAFSVVLEGIPAGLGGEITSTLAIPTIGIGAGPYCDGQVLVVNDMLGLDPEFTPPKFVKRYAELGSDAEEAVKEYMKEVRGGGFPGPEHSY